MTEEDYREKGRYIWQSYVPKSGQSEVVQGELLRASAKLRDEAHRNGNANWDDGHEILAAYLYTTIKKSGMLNNEELALFESDIRRARRFEDPYLKDDLYDRIDKVVIDFFITNPDPISHIKNPDLHR